MALSALSSASRPTATRLVSAQVQGLITTGRGGRGHDSAPTDWLTQTPLVPATNASHCVTARDTLPVMASADDKVEQPIATIWPISMDDLCVNRTEYREFVMVAGFVGE